MVSYYCAAKLEPLLVTHYRGDGSGSSNNGGHGSNDAMVDADAADAADSVVSAPTTHTPARAMTSSGPSSTSAALPLAPTSTVVKRTDPVEQAMLAALSQVHCGIHTGPIHQLLF